MITYRYFLDITNWKHFRLGEPTDLIPGGLAMSIGRWSPAFTIRSFDRSS